LFERLGRAGRVTQVSAPAGSGKTFLLRSWIGTAGLAESAAWVSVQREERNPQQFWVSVLSALRQTAAGSSVVRPLTAAPDLDGWAVVERLLKDLEALQDRAWLVIDDVHELRSAEVLRQLELLLMRAPPKLRCVLATRHDVRLGLHRLRLEGEVTEIRAANLRFTLDEARALFGAAGVELPESALTLLMRGPRAGRPGCGWLPCHWPGTRTRSGSRPSSAVANARWPSTCWLRCWNGRARRCGGCCCGPRYWSGSAGN
jgi:LuxR family maltose regulon positive regulatory protein